MQSGDKMASKAYFLDTALVEGIPRGVVGILRAVGVLGAASLGTEIQSSPQVRLPSSDGFTRTRTRRLLEGAIFEGGSKLEARVRTRS